MTVTPTSTSRKRSRMAKWPRWIWRLSPAEVPPCSLTLTDSHRSCVIKTSWRSAFATLKNQRAYGSQDIRGTLIHAYDVDEVRERGAAVAAEQAAVILRRNGVEGFWIHVDADVLDDAVMPAVEYHLAGGLSWDELSATLRGIDGNGSGGWG